MQDKAVIIRLVQTEGEGFSVTNKKKKYRYVVQIINRNQEVLFEEVNEDLPWKIAHRGNLFFESKNDDYKLIKAWIKKLLNVENMTIYEVERFELKTVKISSSIVFVDDEIKAENAIVRYSSEPVDYFDVYEVYPTAKLKEGKYMLLVKNKETQEQLWMEVYTIFDFFFEIFQKREEENSMNTQIYR